LVLYDPSKLKSMSEQHASWRKAPKKRLGRGAPRTRGKRKGERRGENLANQRNKKHQRGWAVRNFRRGKQKKEFRKAVGAYLNRGGACSVRHPRRSRL